MSDERYSAEQALEALELLHDCARMEIGDDAIGPRKVLESFIEQAAQTEREREVGVAVAEVVLHGNLLYGKLCESLPIGTKLYTAPRATVPDVFLPNGMRMMWEDSIGRKWPCTITRYTPATYDAVLDDGTSAMGYARSRFSEIAAAPEVTK